MNVLVIDDDADVLASVRDCLAQAGRHSVSLASDSSAGLKLLGTRRPDLLLLDWLMPGLTGIDILKQLAEQPRHTRPGYIVMMSAAPDLGMLESLARELGADEVVRKPLRPADIAGMIERAGAATAYPGPAR